MLENRGVGGVKYLRISEVRKERALKQLPDQFHKQGNAVVKMARHTVVTLQIQVPTVFALDVQSTQSLVLTYVGQRPSRQG